MAHNRPLSYRMMIVIGLSVFAIFLIISAALSLTGGARQELEAGGIPYTVDEFVKRAKSGDLEAVELFLAAGIDVDARTITGANAIGWAACLGHLPVVALLIDRGANGLNTALTCAAEGGRTEVVKLLLERGTDVNARNENGMTALMHAAKDGHSETVKFLIQKGADINAKDVSGSTALGWAANFENSDTVKLLQEHGAE